MSGERVVLVDENDNEIGTEEKMKAHQEGKLHRAISVFIFNSKSEMMIHKRADDKYHCGGLWTNTCCSHPRQGETYEESAKRRLKEEMGFEADLKDIFNFTYKVEFDNGLTEHEYDHVFVGTFDGEPNPDPKEVDNWKWVNVEELLNDMKENPDIYTYWFKEIAEKVVSYIKDVQ
ncbi:MAG: isopentenyl-diphosphate Delta-isomerase [Nanoarchaeota archaeon]|nr:isopentenyl-diphosphate Delta-isomerase [Nanoarchaeota archaeon]MBU1135129.1 isopentenyl-diphosphate Delta-isomerase [Nanoarchaeota archaeon]MBU2520139.1 isopentenyl-diphosphate Delta-isomerase [Nanoarchaeota archaeon]